MTRLLILACSATKSSAPGVIAARDRYTGPVWQTYRAVDPRGELALLTVLSAKFGWISGDELIPNYDQKLDELRALELATSVDDSRTRKLARFQDITEICVVGGKLYQYVAQEELRQILDLNPSVRITCICDQIGFMRQKLRAWLLAPVHTLEAA
jgi:hypothetical protein